ncbi:MAG: hypothetical protein AMJ88_03190 [Anaerolineae bacterium SM23_ 63]|nr:MAG: hypothetical protein AMJ88_03190 [Anaerolineae bacterium SM23_ 63]HEY47565.1 hypothetical protein [Anaerolineae bacterium]
MKGKVSNALVVALILSLIVVGVAYAEEGKPPHRIRVLGEIIWVDLHASAFGLHARSGEEYRFEVDRGTHFRSPAGSVKEFSDLEAGMRALVMGFRSEEGLIARLVVTTQVEPQPERVIGEVSGIAAASASFSLKKQNGAVVTIHTTERTHFRGRDGSIQCIEDLEKGMVALVIGFEREDSSLVALIVTAAYREDNPDNLRRFRGEITTVDPEEGTFTLQIIEGASVTFQIGKRTRFVSRDGSVKGLEDLKVGMIAYVGALENEGGWFAFVVAVAIPKDPPDCLWGRGRIAALGDHVFTIESRDGSVMTFFVDNLTRYRSRDGSVEGFEDLQVGMFAIVGAVKLEDGQLKAVFVGVTRASTERPGDAERHYEQPDMQVGP